MSDVVLYRKYRSRNFSEIVGQKHIVPILVESILQGKLAHAYLFSGPRGTGKTSIARLMAKAVNCANFENKHDVCNECEYCLSINQGSSIDIIEMDAASNRGIEEIRNLKESVNFMPSFLKRKVYIIDEAHMLTREAFNALLKTLEEPPEHVMFILATTESNKLPITILSRVQRYDFKLASSEELKAKLSTIISQEGFDTDNDALETLYVQSGGSFRDAESLLGKIISITSGKKITDNDIYKALGLVSEKEIEQFVSLILEGDSIKVLNYLDEMIQNGASISNLIDQVLEFIRKKSIESIKNNNNIAKLAKLTELFITVKREIKDFSDKRLIFEIELLKYLNAADLVYESTSATRSEQSRSVSKLELPSKREEKVSEAKTEKKVEESKPEKTTAANPEDFIEILKEECKTKYPRLRAIINTSEVDFTNGVLTIKNHHNINLEYLKKKDVQDFIRMTADKNLVKLHEIKMGVETVKPEVLDSNPAKAEKSTKLPAEKHSANPKQEAKEVKREVPPENRIEKKVEKDNSDLVEGIL